MTLAETIIAALHARGTRHMFGVPGGGSSLDLIEAARERGIAFVLSGSETSGAFMAAVTAELTGAPGAILAGVGPGAAAAVNGIAYAGLERAPVVMLTDCKDKTPEDGGSLHQSFDQTAMFAPITKAATRLRPADGASAVDALLELALTPPLGPIHIDMSSGDAILPMAAGGNALLAPTTPGLDGDAIAAARELLAKSQRPVILVGLEARDDAAAHALTDLAEALGAAVMTTYKAKGVMEDGNARLIGPFTGAAAEAACVGKADLIVLYGLDPVELVPISWAYSVPLVELSLAPDHRQPATPAVKLVGPLVDSVAALGAISSIGGWPTDDLGALKAGMRDVLALGASSSVTMDSIVDTLAATAPAGTRMTVDAGAHMFSVFQRWSAARPFGVMKSNGLSTMGFALPAAIGSALADPDTPVCAVTGDGGMMMCLAELATAARLKLPIVTVVANDAALSLIDIKQQRQQRPSVGVRYPRVDFAAAARGFGVRGFRVDDVGKLTPILAEAFRAAAHGPVLVDVGIDAAGYGAQLEALRG